MSNNYISLENNEYGLFNGNPVKRVKTQIKNQLLTTLINDIKKYNETLEKNINLLNKQIKQIIYKLENDNNILNDKIEKLLENQTYILDYLYNLNNNIINRDHMELNNYSNNNSNQNTYNMSMFS